ncbi:aquaporin family protein [Aneurinibacillus sp. Ricciae_BoGa-3]|uniref:MIP/aquaporin family protein n=1 Tax=Aneurinibacillus sp. Ricciae_BoGa-3 TaxID=3022697 RepID=UPI00233FFD61|nr:MIP/aquaporin family protein [Aneurinibacillus sp. Ricciae_BoGa-3]WCK52635.1 aquaporin family protein [Aneurinibacillus sp. Ricciae_BoGa-3]
MHGLKGELIAEFIGSFILIFIGAGCVAALILNGAQYTMWDISMIWGLAVSMALYITASKSGAHINPAVTLSLAIYRGFAWFKVLPYILAQIAGTFTASAVVYGLYRNGFIHYEVTKGIIRGSLKSQTLASIFSTYPAPYLSDFQAVCIEMAITACLVASIFAFIDERNSFAPSKAMFPLTVGMVVALMGGAFGTLTGFAMNPARDFGPKLFAALAGWGSVALPGPHEYFWVPIIGPFIGAVIGGGLYDYLIGRSLNFEDSQLTNIDRNEEEVVTSTKAF